MENNFKFYNTLTRQDRKSVLILLFRVLTAKSACIHVDLQFTILHISEISAHTSWRMCLRRHFAMWAMM